MDTILPSVWVNIVYLHDNVPETQFLDVSPPKSAETLKDKKNIPPNYPVDDKWSPYFYSFGERFLLPGDIIDIHPAISPPRKVSKGDVLSFRACEIHRGVAAPQDRQRGILFWYSYDKEV